MLFFCNPKLRKLEAFMQEAPGFPPKGMKIDLSYPKGLMKQVLTRKHRKH